MGLQNTLKALSDPKIYEECKPVIIGDAACMEEAVSIAGMQDKIKIHAMKDIKDAKFEYGTIDVYDMQLVDMKRHVFGKVSKMCGEAAFQYVVKVIELAQKGEIDATVTNALNKEAINMAGHHYSGHTEIYAEYTHTDKYTMMLAHEDLRVVHVSTHVSLRQACDKVKKDRVLEVIRIANDACKALGIENPKIGVAGLNPHCGDDGLLGNEEETIIAPAVKEANENGILAFGPYSPDGFFGLGNYSKFDATLAMYHDQGLAPFKALDFEDGVNFTAGLPVIRTSPDHGTAFSMAGRDEADPMSMMSAIYAAVDIFKRRMAYDNLQEGKMPERQTDDRRQDRPGRNQIE